MSVCTHFSAEHFLHSVEFAVGMSCRVEFIFDSDGISTEERSNVRRAAVSIKFH